MNILYYYPEALGYGDFYLLLPILESLRKKHKKDNITLASSNTIRSLIVNKNIIDDYIVFNNNHRRGEFINKLIIKNKRDIDNVLHQFDKVYDLDVQRFGITLFFRNDMHFFDIMEKEFEVKIDRNKFDSIFKFNLTSEEKDQVDKLILHNDKKNIIIHTGHSYKFPYGKTPNYEWWHELISNLSDYNVYQVGSKIAVEQPSRLLPDFDIKHDNIIDLCDKINFRQIAHLLKISHSFIAIDSIVAHLSLHSMKRGIVLWGSSYVKTHGHDHNINLEAIRHCGKPSCIDLGGMIIDDNTNLGCCLLPELAKPDSWPLVDEVMHELNTL
jgi:ADP-heptose:LPS heptosyltransferase